MKTHYRDYNPEDMIKVRNFLSSSYAKLKRPSNWLIGRFEFEVFFMNKRAGWLPGWEQNIGLWEDEHGELAAVAGRDGDYYFLLDSEEPPAELLREIFAFMEKKSFQNSGDRCKVAIPAGMVQLEELAASRGYQLLNERDSTGCIELSREFPVRLPAGYQLRSGEEVSDRDKAMGHIMAFDYPDTERAELMLEHFGGIREAPSYHPELDLAVVNGQGEVVSFCNVFLDEDNKLGVLEPVGTHKGYRKQGLAKAIIYECLNRLRAMGMLKAYVGPMQPFYERIGFVQAVELKVWESTIRYNQEER
ncbi:GNAT family N-acetyltransferase [Paenibacillus donghaensis]|uniref:N-acetyltransferase domain-containing protein n=1 Tax=Paenibacillus donghaensis TaxID=414771 RepID=A0A2Z2KHT5_9BACL|nr:GNAT family N-acetyltransferase [Paenibacillus donghaensis]ASA20432.1 hypothetical protein B9T62_06205 [Paenibacillus donghaensis]